MNTETNTDIIKPAITNPAKDEPADIDVTIQTFLDRAFKIAKEDGSNPKDVCALGWLVLKIKECHTKTAVAQTPPMRALSAETIRQIEAAAKML